MPTPRLPLALQEKVVEALAAGKKHRAIERELGVSQGAISRIKDMGIRPPVENTASAPENGLSVAIRSALKRGPKSVEELADELDCGPGKIKQAIADMEALGAMLLRTVDGKYDLGSSIHLEPGKHELAGSASEEWTHRYGVTTDNHLCNRQSRRDVLHEAYDHFERMGISSALNAGNMIDGEARFNKTELLTRPGMDAQTDYWIDNFPQRTGITTYFVAGDDHEGWYQQREGIEIGRYMQLRAEQQGRHDLKYLGYGECDIKLTNPFGSSCLRLVHPGGGSSYAISYTDQKRVESYQGGEKPQVEVAGHYHKYNAGYPRGVFTLQAGCTCDQTMFMRKKRLEAHVGFSTLFIQQGDRGQVTRVAHEWFPRYNRSYYEKRF
jgi:hypothetical protein